MADEHGMMQRLEGIKNLPTLPIVIDRLAAAIRDPNSDAKRVARIISDDPAIMARVMKVVNSAFYGGHEPITSVDLAVSRLGMLALRNIALSTSVFTAFGAGTGAGFDRKEFWRHAISSGIAATVVSSRAQKQLSRRYGKDVLHLCGLLHDIGKIVYDQFFHDEFAEALRIAATEQIPLFSAEQRVLGLDHAQAGMWMGVKWQLGLDLTQVIYGHHDPERAEEKYWEPVALVHTANYICNLEKIGNSGDPVPAFLPGVWKRLGLTVGDISGVVDEVHEEAKKSEILMAMV